MAKNRNRNISFPSEATIKTNDSVAQNIILSSADTTIYIDSLLPNKTYTFKVELSSNQNPVSSNEVTATTMDTTSHNFTWQTFTFGEHSSSVLYDVAILNENNIIVVGTIFLNDSIGQPDPQAYGVAIWDGQTWELKKLFYNNDIPVTPKGILALTPNEIYLASGSIFRWDETSDTVKMVYSRLNLPDPNGTIEKLHGNSSSSIYSVGNAGSIVFNNGSVWQSIESETDLNINNIWADYNDRLNEWEILAVGGNILQSTERIILKITNQNQVQQISAEGTIV